MRVLLVQGRRSAVTSGLGDGDTVVACAEDADEAMPMLSQVAYDLVLLDMCANSKGWV